jgi:hypothetical protein
MSKIVPALALPLAVLTALALPTRPVHAETCSEAIEAQTSGELEACLIGILSVEDPGDDPQQMNIAGSGSLGCFQFQPSTWASTPEGDVPLAVASAAEQVESAAALIMAGGVSNWAASAPASCYEG